MKNSMWYAAGLRQMSLDYDLYKGYDGHTLTVYLFTSNNTLCHRIIIPKTLYGVWWVYTMNHRLIKNNDDYISCHKILKFGYYPLSSKARPIEEFLKD